MKLSVVIITYNEEKNIARCLASVKDIADEIIIVDSFSTDKTKEICASFPLVKFIQKKWEGYSLTKNYANLLTTNNWILSLDADETLSFTLKESISKIKTENYAVDFYEMNRLTNYCGTWIYHCGWFPDKKIRLFNKQKTKWEGIVHEKLCIPTQSKIGFLQGNILHYSYYSVEEHYKQTERYTKLKVHTLFEKGKRAYFFQPYVYFVSKFIICYFIRLGFLDGKAGFLISKVSAFDTFLKYKYLLSLQKGNNKT